MKQSILLSLFMAGIFMSCDNESKDSVQKADSANEAKRDNAPDNATPDAATSEFLVDAADGGMAEVAMGDAATKKASHTRVKAYAAMMVKDHSDANGKVKALAAARNVTLPAAPSEDHQQHAGNLNEKTGKDFDKAFMDMMVDDHEKVIRRFETGFDNSKDEEVRNFINATLPTLRMHLDSAKAIRDALK
jgi:putative membrane protein